MVAMHTLRKENCTWSSSSLSRCLLRCICDRTIVYIPEIKHTFPYENSFSINWTQTEIEGSKI